MSNFPNDYQTIIDDMLNNLANNASKSLTKKQKAKQKKDKRDTRKSQAVTAIIYERMIYERNGQEQKPDDEEFHREYVSRICKLPTKDLVLILRTSKAMNRRTDTIECIKQEIAEREMLKT
jgi:hypothetical protein